MLQPISYRMWIVPQVFAVSSIKGLINPHAQSTHGTWRARHEHIEHVLSPCHVVSTVPTLVPATSIPLLLTCMIHAPCTMPEHRTPTVAAYP